MLGLMASMTPKTYRVRSSEVSADGSKATLYLSAEQVDKGKTETVLGTATLLKEGGAWKVDLSSWGGSQPSGPGTAGRGGKTGSRRAGQAFGGRAAEAGRGARGRAGACRACNATQGRARSQGSGRCKACRAGPAAEQAALRLQAGDDRRGYGALPLDHLARARILGAGHGRA